MKHKPLKFALIALAIVLYGNFEGPERYVALFAIGWFLGALWSEDTKLEDALHATGEQNG